MVSYPRRPQSGHIICYLNRTYHVLPTVSQFPLDRACRFSLTFHDYSRVLNLSRSLRTFSCCLRGTPMEPNPCGACDLRFVSFELLRVHDDPPLHTYKIVSNV
jgi:hypothetical protein